MLVFPSPNPKGNFQSNHRCLNCYSSEILRPSMLILKSDTGVVFGTVIFNFHVPNALLSS